MSYLRKRGTDEILVSTPALVARLDMLPVTEDQAKAIIKGELSLKGSDFSQTTTEDGKKLVTKFLRKHGTNELFLYTDALALRGDMVPTTEAQAALIRDGQMDYQKLENVQVDATQPTTNPDDGRVDMTEPPPTADSNLEEVKKMASAGEPLIDITRAPGSLDVPPSSAPPAPLGAGTETVPPQTTGNLSDSLSDLKKEQIAKLGTMSKDEMISFVKDKFQVSVDKRKNEETVREIVTLLIQENP